MKPKSVYIKRMVGNPMRPQTLLWSVAMVLPLLAGARVFGQAAADHPRRPHMVLVIADDTMCGRRAHAAP
jgi:hypothetical protein